MAMEASGQTPTVAHVNEQAAALSASRHIWTRRQLLVAAIPVDSYKCSLPLVLESDDRACFADVDKDLVYCEDGSDLQHGKTKLVWLSSGEICAASKSLCSCRTVKLHLYLSPECAEYSQRDVSWKSLRQQIDGRVAKMVEPEDVFLMADMFRRAGGSNTWITFYDDEAAAQSASVVPLPLPTFPAQDQGKLQPKGQALKLDPSCGRLSLRRRLPRSSSLGRLHLRVHFFDLCDEKATESSHWLGLSSHLGACALGLAPGLEDNYGFLNGFCPDGAPGHYFSWQRSTVERSKGWHLFELVLDGGSATMAIDGERIFTGPADGATLRSADHVWLVAKRGSWGCWAELEVVQLPGGCVPVWALGSRVRAPKQPLWEIQAEEYGRWEADSDGLLWRLRDEAQPSLPAIAEKEEEAEAKLPAVHEMPGWRAIVRCGGGYLDAGDFLKRQGKAADHLRCKKLASPCQAGKQELRRFVTFRSQGCLQMTECRPATSGAWRRPSSSGRSLPRASTPVLGELRKTQRRHST